ncbi:hypothetical protein BS78_05G084100 [Paspalum vaginatum]|nr:hypothetical protein BS78_05G084100 [Paspalum vaginatum]
MLQPFDGLCVLKLSACILSFASPPFLCCRSLRFLWLDHCRYESSKDDAAGNEEDIRRCFQRLWVLDVRYSSPSFLSTKMMDFMTQLRELGVMGQDIQDMAALQERLHNIRKLRVTKSRVTASSRRRYRDDDKGTILFSGKDKMELLDFSESNSVMSLYVVSSCSRLETVIIDGSPSLENISLKGCAKLKNLLFSGLFPQLLSLDISGTAVKTLDLSAVAAPKLDELFLLDCGKLYVILWPSQDKRKRYLGKLHIDTNQTEGSTAAVTAGRPPITFSWCISTRDVRLLQSLAPVQYYFHIYSAHVEISTTLLPSPARRLHADASSSGNKGGRMKGGSWQQARVNMQQRKVYADVKATFTEDTGMHQLQQANAEDHFDAWAIMSVCPPPPTSWSCCMRIEDKMVTTSGTLLQAAGHIAIPGFICDGARILHVHHSLSSSGIFADALGSSWDKLEWCRAERCPKLECVFSPQLFVGAVPPEGSSRQAISIFNELKTIWASHLLNARYVLEHPAGSKGPMYRAFAGLTLLHLYCCPRLAYAIPLQARTMSLENLETIEIMWCADLSVAFHLYEETSDHQGWYGGGSWSFPNLKYIHLHELPRLRGIFNVPWECILAPKLEIIRIRGCWSLKALPMPTFIYKSDMVECDCEKEWWGRMQENHCRALAYQYKVTHPRYYKKTMLKGSVLR